ncbi:MAG: sensor histidine kinase [Clostridia bacterium]|nr:sensor histidine kinase [Clostridia bacterium]
MEKLNFNVDAYTARLIGRENVSRLESAILELVKNTYDADADCCILYYESSTNSLYLADNGTGMSTEIIKKHWMTIGNSSKKRKYISNKGRVQTGAKGIGRFALDRIGDTCKMYTKSFSENLEWNINWSNFSDGTPLTNVTADLEEVLYTFDDFINDAVNSEFRKLVSEKFKDNGTVFKISSVRDNWNDRFIKKLRRNLSTLVPQEMNGLFDIYLFEEKTSLHEAKLVMSISETTCDYKVSFEVNGDDVHTIISRNEFDFKTQKNIILSEAGFNENDKSYFSGQDIIEDISFRTLMSSKKNIIENTIGNFKGVFLFSKIQYQDDDKEKYFYKNSKQMTLPWNGIRIYRDNFRVRPYGDPESSAYDWLLLSNRKAKSPAAPSHEKGKWRVSADQICGTILISRTNISLPDQANREGFVETPEFQLLKNFLLKIIQMFENDRQYVFRKLSSYYDLTHPTQQYEKEIATKAANSKNEPEGNKDDNNSEPSISQNYVEASKAQAVINKKDAQIQNLENENQLLRALATIGVVTNTYVHEIRANTNNLGLKIVMAKEALEYDKDIENALMYINDAYLLQKSFGSWFKVTLESVRKDRRTMKNVDISLLLNELKEAWNNTCKDLNISIECEDIVFRCFPYEIESIFNNLIANSTSIFKSENQKEQKIKIRVELVEGYLNIYYEDNGPGLSSKYKYNPDLILESMETDKTDLDGEVIGTGMGMWIIWKTVEEYKGNIDLSENSTSEKGFYVRISLKGH